jgi:hypothetical protein
LRFLRHLGALAEVGSLGFLVTREDADVQATVKRRLSGTAPHSTSNGTMNSQPDPVASVAVTVNS